MNKELKLCPFCGGEAKMTEYKAKPEYGIDYLFWTFCVNCMCTTRILKTEEEAIAAWNRRANSEEEGN